MKYGLKEKKMDIREELRQFMQKRGYTITDISSMTGLNRSTISRLVANKRQGNNLDTYNRLRKLIDNEKVDGIAEDR